MDGCHDVNLTDCESPDLGLPETVDGPSVVKYVGHGKAMNTMRKQITPSATIAGMHRATKHVFDNRGVEP